MDFNSADTARISLGNKQLDVRFGLNGIRRRFLCDWFDAAAAIVLVGDGNFSFFFMFFPLLNRPATDEIKFYQI